MNILAVFAYAIPVMTYVYLGYLAVNALRRKNGKYRH